jgi:hypothetical protein
MNTLRRYKNTLIGKKQKSSDADDQESNNRRIVAQILDWNERNAPIIVEKMLRYLLRFKPGMRLIRRR